MQDILIILVGAIIIWVKKVLEKEFEDLNTGLNNQNNNIISAINQINTNISNLNTTLNNFSKNDAHNQNHINIYIPPERVKTTPEELKEAAKQNESPR